jgi:type II secretory pathway component PulK
VLIVVIWVVFILASLVIVFGHSIRVEAMAASNYIAQVKAQGAADAAISYALAMLAAGEESRVSYGASPFEAMEVGDARFWILRPNLSDHRNYEFGLVDEGGKINLNEVSLETMLKLPGMTSELANSIIDWRDENEEVTSGGAESEYYLLLADPYQCKNAPLETVEEVLLIKGGSLKLLYGEDTNRNGILDWNENDGNNSPPDDNSNGRLDPGFFNYVTIHSYEINVDSEGQERVNVNRGQNRGRLARILEAEFGQTKTLQILANIPTAPIPFENIIHYYQVSGMEYADFSKIIDRVTVDGRQRITGRINVNNAPEEVLLCLPELEQSDVESLIRKRSQSDTNLDSVLWVTQVLDPDKARAIGSYITTQSFQYSADIVAASNDGRAFCRYYVVIDTAGQNPRVIYKQSLHQTGWPLDPTILESLRQGKEI